MEIETVDMTAAVVDTDNDATAPQHPLCIPSRLAVVPNDEPPTPANTENITASSATSTRTTTTTTGCSTAASGTPILTIRIVEREEQLLQLLKTVTEHYNRNLIDVDSGSGLVDGSSSATATITTSSDQSGGSRSRRLVVRIAGGWVRDKILGYPYDQNTNDIDIAINILTGVQFAELIQQAYVQQQQLLFVSSSSSSPSQQQPNVLKMGVIAANPEQSKHLETACMKLFNIDVDFTNLRCNEVYSHPDNRIPDTTIQFGTPRSDAYRRDFTINALYYNVETSMIEDYTHCGLDDLQNRFLQTPLNPRITFVDDPLRILRAIRFAIRFQLNIDERIVVAAKDPIIQTALQCKVSRERVGKELEGMMSGKCANPIAALQTIHQLHLSSCIFTLPIIGVQCTKLYGTFLGQTYQLPAGTDGSSSAGSSCCSSSTTAEGQTAMFNHWDESLSLLSIVQRLWELHTTFVRHQQGESAVPSSPTNTSRIDARLLPLATYLLPFRKLQYTEVPKNNAATIREWNVVAFIMKDSIKFKNTDVQAMTTILHNLDPMIQLLIKYCHTETEQNTGSINTDLRLEVGMILCDAKELWVTVLILAVIVLTRQHDTNEYRHTTTDGENIESTQISTSTTRTTTAAMNEDVRTTTNGRRLVDSWIQISHSLYNDIIYQLELDHCWSTIRPVMNGQELIRELNLPKGPTVGLYMAEQMKYLLRYPKSTKQECVLFLQQQTVSIAAGVDTAQQPSEKQKSSNKKKRTSIM